FRRGFPYLAVAPIAAVEVMDSWRYFSGLAVDGKPVFQKGEGNARPIPPFGMERPPEPAQPPYHRCVGEFSIGQLPAWRKWVMLYACCGEHDAGFTAAHDRGIFLRTAKDPWGPWSPPQLLLDPKDAYCHFMHLKGPCPPGLPNPGDKERAERHPDLQPKFLDDGEMDLMAGGEYAPFLIPSYTKVDGGTTYLYFVMSTWNPYQSVLMRTRVQNVRAAAFEDLRSVWRRGVAFFRSEG
ncbi:MAG TPA: DUF4185 domain-containing protein, partial [Vicinamibacteria bacterium]